MTDAPARSPLRAGLAQLRDPSFARLFSARLISAFGSHLALSEMQQLTVLRLAVVDDTGVVDTDAWVVEAAAAMERMFDPAVLAEKAALMDRAEVQPVVKAAMAADVPNTPDGRGGETHLQM